MGENFLHPVFFSFSSTSILCERAQGNILPTTEHSCSFAKISFPSFQSLLHEMILRAKSYWQLQSLSPTQLRLSDCLQNAYKKGILQIPPAVFISTVAGEQREYWAEYSLYRRGVLHFTELTLHSHAPRSSINIEWLITVLHGYRASFVIGGGIWKKSTHVNLLSESGYKSGRAEHSLLMLPLLPWVSSSHERVTPTLYPKQRHACLHTHWNLYCAL